MLSVEQSSKTSSRFSKKSLVTKDDENSYIYNNIISPILVPKRIDSIEHIKTKLKKI